MSIKIPVEAQALILPINQCIISSSYKNVKYKQIKNFDHYGIDLFNESDRIICSPGIGIVIEAGLDGRDNKYAGMGNIVIILYKNVFIHAENKVQDLICRMFHLDQVFVEIGDIVDTNTAIGLYGNTGGLKMERHLHIEFDTNINQPLSTWGMIPKGSKLLAQSNIDTSINPSSVWFLKNAAPNYQTIKGGYVGWYSEEDINIPTYLDVEIDIPDIIRPSASLIETLTQLEMLRTENVQLNDKIESIQGKFSEEIARLQNKYSLVEVQLSESETVINSIRTLLNKV